MALLAVALGVALAFSVHLINASALAEFAAAVRACQRRARPQRCAPRQRAGFDEALVRRAWRRIRGVALASPVLEVDSHALDAAAASACRCACSASTRCVVAALAPALLPRPADGADRSAVLDPDAVFLNAGRAAAASALRAGDTLQRAARPRAGARCAWPAAVRAGGAPLAVMDIAGAQAAFGRLGRLTRIDLRLAPGADRERVLRELRAAGRRAQRGAGRRRGAARVSNLSRAYRVNLTVLALVALFTGAFLVFSVLALSVAQRTPQFALLGVLGLTRARAAARWCWPRRALLGLVGSVLGLALGTALAALALRWLGGDLGGGYFPGVAPQLRWIAGGRGAVRRARRARPRWSAAGCRRARRRRCRRRRRSRAWASARARGALALARAGCCWPPARCWRCCRRSAACRWRPTSSVALLLVGGIACVPAGVRRCCCDRLRAARGAPLLRCWRCERARHQRDAAHASRWPAWWRA